MNTKCPRVNNFLAKESKKTGFDPITIYEGTPNFSMRMTPMAAILVRHQLKEVEQKIKKFNCNWWILYKNVNSFHCINDALDRHIYIEVAPRLLDEEIVGTSFLFNVMMKNEKKLISDEDKYTILEQFSQLLSERGITHAWFGRKQCLGFTSTFKHWRYISSYQGNEDHNTQEQYNEKQEQNEGEILSSSRTEVDESILPKTNTFLLTLFDIPLYHTSTWADQDFFDISDIIRNCLQDVCDSAYIRHN